MNGIRLKLGNINVIIVLLSWQINSLCHRAATRNQNDMATRMRNYFDGICICLDTIHECEGRTDEQTDGHRPAASTALASCGKNEVV